MSEKTPHRRPATFKLDDPGVVVMDPEDVGRPARGTVRITPDSDPSLLPVPLDVPLVPVRRGFRWGTLFFTAAGGLVLLGVGLGIVNLVEDLFARSQSLGEQQAGPHSLELVSTVSGVEYINDSKSTHLDATLQAMAHIDKPIVWIAGNLAADIGQWHVQEFLRERVAALVLF